MHMDLRNTSPTRFLAGEDQPVSFAELFFDLVFVFCVTQVVRLLENSFDLLHVGRSILVFWLIWWAWTQFTWALNAADTRQTRIVFATMLATAFAFFMAVTVPQAFDSLSWWFAASYVIVRSIGLLIYLSVVWGHEGMRTVVKSFATISIAGLVAVIAGGLLGGNLQYWCWGMAIALDVIAATVGSNKEGWNLYPKHFAERHGLFVIIALGETLIVAASAAAKEPWSGDLILVSSVAIGITSCLWWLYFFRIKDHLEHAMAHRTGSSQSSMARDVFSLFHFPMICGLIIYAYAIEEAMLYPSQPMSPAGRIALATGIFLYSIGLVIAYWRATGKVLILRAGLTIIVTAICFITSASDVFWTLTICFSGLVLLCLVELKTEKEHGKG